MMRAMPVTIPRRVREMTSEWLSDVFEEVGIDAPSITALDVEQINVGTGFAGRVLRLRPTYEGDANGAPTSLIAKTPSPDPTMRALIAELRGYEVEALFYRELLERTPTPVPKCIWNGSDIERGDFVLLLEDLEGYAIGGQVGDDVDADLVADLIREAARLHRAWWNDSALDAQSGLPGPAGSERQVWPRSALAGWAVWERASGPRAGPTIVTGLRSAMERFAELAERSAEGATTLVHGDFRLDNAMRSAENSERPLVVLDWQLTHSGSGAYDIAYLLGQSVPTELRRRHEEEWLALYLDELGRPDYTKERLSSDVAIGLLLSMSIPINGVGMNENLRTQVAEMPEGPVRDGYRAALDAADQLMTVMTDRCLAAIEDHDALRVLA
jgi:hypothetical protein